MLTSGKGRYQVWLKKQKIGEDLIYILGGGEKPHVGGIVISEPGKKPIVIKLERHKDYIVLKKISEAACKKYNTKAVAIGGIHIDNAKKEEIDLILKNCSAFIKKI